MNARSATPTTTDPGLPDSQPARRLPRPRVRPVLVLITAVAIAAASFGLNRLGLGGRPPSTGPGASPAVVGGPPSGAPRNATDPGVAVAPPDGGLGGGDPVAAATDTSALTKAIAVWAGNLERDPADFVSAQNLALIYYTRGRLTGSADDYVRAQEAVDQGLAAYPDSLGGRTMKALLQYTLHDFEAARTEAAAIYAADPTALQALATVGDSQLELGQYDAAAATFADLAKREPGAAVTARLARLAALRGDDKQAASLAAQATREAKAEGAEGTSLAFYPYLEGSIAFQAGRLADAVAAHRAALAAWPGSHLAHEGLGRALAAQGKTDAAITEFKAAIAIVPQPEYLAALGDLYALDGRSDLADRQYATVRAIAGLQATLYNRQLVLFDVNHAQNLTEALSLADGELAVRKDVYGWDATAWALLANGRAADAAAAMEKAMALGTHDALLDYHAGMIAAALGRTTEARTLLQRALDRNPGFDPLQATRARATLATLPAG